jgi:hypothetical protein
MATRHSYRIILAEKNKRKQLKFTPILHIYSHYDGYPEGNPHDLAVFLNNAELKHNGTTCLAAQILTFQKLNKDGEMVSGNVYIQKPKNRCEMDEEYLYDIVLEDVYDWSKFTTITNISIVGMKNDESKTVFFTGTPQEFLNTYQKK